MKTKIRGDYDRVNEEERDWINKKLEDFEEKFGDNFSEMLVKIDCQEEKKTSRGRKGYVCKLHVSTDKGNFHAEAEDFGCEKTIVDALNKVERQIKK